MEPKFGKMQIRLTEHLRKKYTDYGWVNTEDGLQLLCFTGSCVPASLTRPSNQATTRATTSDDTVDASSTDDEHSDNA